MRTRQITPLSDFDKRAILDDMQRYKSKDIVRFIEKDLEYGLTREEVEFYSNKKYSFEKMKIISNAFRRGCSIEDIQALIELDISSMMLEQALEYCYKGVGIGDIKKAIASSTNAREFRCALDNLISESNNKESLASNKIYDIKIQQLIDDYEQLKREMAVEDIKIELQIQEIKEKLDTLISDKNDEVKAIGIGKEDIEYPPTKNTNRFKDTMLKLGLKKSSRDIVKLVTKGELDSAQIEQIKRGVASKLDEEQLSYIINSDMSADQMKGIIDIAIMQNKMKDTK
ncbi:MAG: hypothetical protein E7262_00675 [Lachnospiraceae bacterium]|nr:hypothetical protein [Lachnospiraceae bacterium]